MRKLITWICLVLMLSLPAVSALAAATPVLDSALMEPAHLTENRHFAGMPAIERTGDRFWASWTSGGVKEPDGENYVLLAYSDDNCQTWTEPYMILDPGPASRACDSVLWQSPDGRLWFFYWDQGAWYIYTDNPCDAPEDIIWSNPKKVDTQHGLSKPIALEIDGVMTYLMPAMSPASRKYVQFLRAEAPDFKWKVVSGRSAKSTNPDCLYLEPVLLEKLDGTLELYTRIDYKNGDGVERAVSTDQGKKWSKLVDDVPYPFQGPGSRFYICRLQSGHLLWVSHDTTQSRTLLTAWLSEDDGATWPYKLLLDERASVSYPDVTQGTDGAIYVIYDKGRSTEQEIRLAVFTEDDLRAGAFVSEAARQKAVVSKTGGYEDIISVAEAYEQTFTVTDQAACEALLAALPTTLTLTTETGATHVLSGEWKLGQVKDGMALAGFTAPLPEKVQDTFGLLTIEIHW